MDSISSTQGGKNKTENVPRACNPGPGEVETDKSGGLTTRQPCLPPTWEASDAVSDCISKKGSWHLYFPLPAHTLTTPTEKYESYQMANLQGQNNMLFLSSLPRTATPLVHLLAYHTVYFSMDYSSLGLISVTQQFSKRKTPSAWAAFSYLYCANNPMRPASNY